MSYYTDLGILPTASMEEISIAYNNLMSEDIDLDDKIRYNKSFATLENYNSRRKYDNLMEANTKVVTAYNNETFYSFLSINNESSNNEHIQNKNDNIQNNNEEPILINIQCPELNILITGVLEIYLIKKVWVKLECLEKPTETE